MNCLHFSFALLVTVTAAGEYACAAEEKPANKSSLEIAREVISAR